MFDRIVAELKSVEAAGLSRRELGEVTSALANARSALDALEIRVAGAVEELGDRGGDAEAMLRAEGGNLGPGSQAP